MNLLELRKNSFLNSTEIYKDYIAAQLKELPNIDISNKCILQCIYCQRQAVFDGKLSGREKVKMSRDMPFEDYQKVIKSFRGINLCGQLSDPIYHPQLLDYLQYASDHGKRINIHTNGSGKKKSFWKQAFSIQSRIEWTFGIDGLDQNTCNLHRIGQNFHQSFKAMLLGSKSNHHIIWQFIPFQHNEHQIERAKAIARKHNITFMLLKSNRWDQVPVYVDNKILKPHWIKPPTDTTLTGSIHVVRDFEKVNHNMKP